MSELTVLMKQKLPEGGVYLAEQKPHMEVIDEVTGNADDQPVREQLIDGLRFINVAQPKFQTSGQTDSGLLEVMVNNAHVIGFAAGRQLSVLLLTRIMY